MRPVTAVGREMELRDIGRVLGIAIRNLNANPDTYPPRPIPPSPHHQENPS